MKLILFFLIICNQDLFADFTISNNIEKGKDDNAPRVEDCVGFINEENKCWKHYGMPTVTEFYKSKSESCCYNNLEEEKIEGVSFGEACNPVLSPQSDSNTRLRCKIIRPNPAKPPPRVIDPGIAPLLPPALSAPKDTITCNIPSNCYPPKRDKFGELPCRHGDRPIYQKFTGHIPKNTLNVCDSPKPANGESDSCWTWGSEFILSFCHPQSSSEKKSPKKAAPQVQPTPSGAR